MKFDKLAIICQVLENEMNFYKQKQYIKIAIQEKAKEYQNDKTTYTNNLSSLL
jgi:hypothetical protein